MIKIEDLKKLLENSKLKFKETETGLIIFKEDEYNHLFEIKQVLKVFGVKQSDIELTDDGTIVKSKEFDSQKLKMLLSPYFPLENMKVISAFELKLEGLFLDINEDAEASADDLGEVPTDNSAVVSNDDNLNQFEDIEDLAKYLDNKLNINIAIVDDNTIEIETTDELVEFLNTIENLLENFDVEIYEDITKITKK